MLTYRLESQQKNAQIRHIDEEKHCDEFFIKSRKFSHESVGNLRKLRFIVWFLKKIFSFVLETEMDFLVEKLNVKI